jgi:hypothetical protein
MSAIASLEDLKAAQENLLEAKDLHELKAIFKKWRSGQWTKKRVPWDILAGFGRAAQVLREGMMAWKRIGTP